MYNYFPIVILCVVVSFNCAAILTPVTNTNNTKKQSEQWKVLLDPTKDEFWHEGNHIPDKGFLIFAKDPTVENAKNWLLRMENKALRLEVMMKLVASAEIELINEGKMKDRYNAIDVSNNNFVKSNNANIDLKKLEYYFIFLPNCSHCHQLAQKLVGIFNVVPLQATKDPLVHFSGLSKSIYADQSTLSAYAKDKNFPVLVILLREKNKATILKGNVPLETIIRASGSILKPIIKGSTK